MGFIGLDCGWVVSIVFVGIDCGWVVSMVCFGIDFGCAVSFGGVVASAEAFDSFLVRWPLALSLFMYFVLLEIIVSVISVASCTAPLTLVSDTPRSGGGH